MMDSLRNAAKSWVAKVLLGLLAGSFVIWGVADVFRGFGASALATVGGIEISGQDYNRALNTYLQNLGRQTGQPMTVDDARKLGLDRGIGGALEGPSSYFMKSPPKQFDDYEAQARVEAFIKGEKHS